MSNGRNIRLRGRLHNYTVGYGKPPKKNRFQKGESGNPRGRPKGAKSRRLALPEERLRAIVLKEAYRTIDMREGDRTISLTMAQAIIRALNVGAAKGQFRAQRLATEMLTSIEREDKAAYDAYVGTAMNYKFAWEQELERRKKHGITDAPQPLPHPDHIKLDLRAGTARIVGPSTKEEKGVYDRWVAQRLELLEKIDALLEKFKAAKKHAVMKKLLNEMDLIKARLQEIRENPPEGMSMD